MAIATEAFDVESLVVYPGNRRSLSVQVVSVGLSDEYIMLIAGTPLAIEGRAASQDELISWLRGAGGVVMEVDRDPERYGKVLAARFAAGGGGGGK
jgi:hypothetical protein